MRALNFTLLVAVHLICVGRPVLAQKTHAVNVNPDLTFSPAQLTIDAGDTVVWTNQGGFHNVRSDDGGFRCAAGCDDSGGDGSPSDTPWSFSHTFPAPGENPYFCEVHGAPGGTGMAGNVTVVESDPDDGGGGGGGGGGGNDDGDEPEDPDPGEPGGSQPPAPPQQPDRPKRFVSGFEVAGFGDWDLRSCSSCQLMQGSVPTTEGMTALPPSTSTEPSERSAWLLAEPVADVDLVLARRTPRGWVPVATGATASAHEIIHHTVPPGTYRWEVRSTGGVGSRFELLTDQRATDATHLIQTSEARHLGHLGAAPVWVTGSEASDYLIDELPAPAREYRASFNIQPLDSLSLHGRRPQLLQLRDHGKLMLRVKLLRAARPGGVRLSAAARVGGGWSRPGNIALPHGKWQRVTLIWRAASAPGSSDGSVELRRGARTLWRLDGLANAGSRVTEVRFGLITSGGDRSGGRLYLDDFVSDWSF